MSNSLVCVGAILGVHGLKGTLTVYSNTRPASGIAGYSCWYLGATEQLAKAFPVRRCWQHGKGVLVELEGVDNRDQAEALKKQKIWVSSDEVEVDEDEFLWKDLIGCEVYQQETLLGSVLSLEDYGAQDILAVKGEAGEWMLPFTEQIVETVDLDKRRIDVCLLEGMEACFTPKS
ncbi:MAG: ribosome maturation factor RimM [Mariprofundaceae bacterium]